MRFLNLLDTHTKRVRGLKRKWNDMINNLTNLTEVFPDNDGESYWHVHLPVSQAFIDSKKTPNSVRRLCVQTIINRVQHLIDNKPSYSVNSHVVASIDLPNLWDSQLIVIFDQDYFSSFFNRDNEYQRWIPLDPNRNLINEWNLTLPSNLQFKGYIEEIYDEEKLTPVKYGS